VPIPSEVILKDERYYCCLRRPLLLEEAFLVKSLSSAERLFLFHLAVEAMQVIVTASHF
jgi:hypothetical protein